jgi:hypothetical protein
MSIGIGYNNDRTYEQLMNHVPENNLIHLFEEKIIDGSAWFFTKGCYSDGYQLAGILPLWLYQ